MNDLPGACRPRAGANVRELEQVMNAADSMVGGKPHPGSARRRKRPGRPVVLAVVDRQGWAHDFKTRQLARNLRDEFDIREVYQQAVRARDLAGADLVMVYYWIQIRELSEVLPELERLPSPLLLGVCSHFELEDERRAPGLDTLNRTAGTVFVNNLGLYRELHPVLSAPLFYTPNGVDTKFFRPGPARQTHAGQPFRVGWAGSLTNQGRSHRGFDEFIVPAVASVKEAVLVTAVREERWRSRAEMRRFYQSLDACVCASASEGTPNPCLEASACGVPVITTAVGNMPEFIRDGRNGYIVGRDVQSIAARLRTLAQDPCLRASMSREARLAAERWSWNLQAERYRRMFRFCIRRTEDLKKIIQASAAESRKTFLLKAGAMARTAGTPWVWGSGTGGRSVAAVLDESGIPWRGFIDSDTLRCGTLVSGRPVRQPDVLCDSEPAAVIIASWAAADICAVLVESGRIEGEDFLVAPLDALAVGL